MHAAIDHLVVTAPSLDAGSKFIRRELDVDMQPGGEHPLMGTHNLLLKLGETTYLEVIAVNPRAPRPPRPRWFDLDRIGPEDAPRLAAWVARIDDVHAAVAASRFDFGTPTRMSRGALSWWITISDEGAITHGGLAPALVEWLEGCHPASILPESRCRLQVLEGVIPATRARFGFQLEGRCVNAGPAGLRAVIDTPAGARSIPA